jgi:hypothetical protein
MLLFLSSSASSQPEDRQPTALPLPPCLPSEKSIGHIHAAFRSNCPPFSSLLFSSLLYPGGGTRKENPEQVNYKRGRMYHQNSRSGAEQQPAPKIEECYTDERTGGPVRRRGVKQASGGPRAQTPQGPPPPPPLEMHGQAQQLLEIILLTWSSCSGADQQLSWPRDLPRLASGWP